MTSTPEERKTNVSFGVVTELTVASETVNLILEKIQDRKVTVFRGGMIAGQRLLVVALLEELIPDEEFDAPDSIQNLAITKLAVELRPDKGSFAFEAAIENAWSITLDSGPTLSVDRLALSVLSVNPSSSTNGKTAEALSQQRKLGFEGLFQLFGDEFRLKVVHQFASVIPAGSPAIVASQWGFSATAEKISITEIIKTFGFSQDKLDEYGLSKLDVSLKFTLIQTRWYKADNTRIEESSYIFRGELLWDTGIELVPGEETLQIEAVVQIAKTSSNEPGAQQSALQGQIAGTVRASIPFFDTLQLRVIYTFTKASLPSGGSSRALATRTGELIFQLQISTMLLNAVYTSVPDPKEPDNQLKNRKLLRFSVGSEGDKKPTIGDLIAYIVSLYDPSITDFELDPPWDEFAKQEIALDKFSLEIDLTQKSVTISYQATLDVLIAKVSNVGMSYQFGADPAKAKTQQKQARTTSNKKVAIALTLSIPGQPEQRVQWDPVNENPPAVPGTKAPIFELQFLALGQRVAFAPEIVQQARTIEQFTDVMRQSLVPLPPIKRRQNPLTALLGALPSAVSSDPTKPIQFSGQPIRFSAESGWLIGAQFSILGSIDISVIFNDPFIYGLRISLSGPPVESFAGFEFEILYRRISDTIGVYRSELVLPDHMRYMQFGAVNITLPVVAIEIYTNGDFGIDVGFPWGGDFSRSIAVNVGTFLGVGGFYFNKLSAETATSVPRIVDGTFNPVVEFGIGLKVGLGKTLQKGPLRAEFSITMHGLLQGVFATYNPTDTNQQKATYYKVQGGVAIVGRIYGAVDFKVIRVDIEVIVRVAVQFVVEVYKAIQVALVAEVSVRASVKVLFITVSFSFKLTVREQFVLGSDSIPPWRLADPNDPKKVTVRGTSDPAPRAVARGAMAFAPANWLARPEAISRRVTAANTRSVASAGGKQEIVLNRDEDRSLRWDPITLEKPDQLPDDKTWEKGKLRLDIYFQPAFTKAVDAATGQQQAVNGVALLFIENSIPDDSNKGKDNDTDFDEMVKALFKWVIYAYLTDDERKELKKNSVSTVDFGKNNKTQIQISLEVLEDIYKKFVNDLDTQAPDALWTPLVNFLNENFIFDITDHPKDENGKINGTVFPMFPQLQMELKDGSDTVPPPVYFDGTKYSPDQIKEIQTYFQSLNYNHDQATDENMGRLPENNATKGLAIAELLFIDYFTLLMRSTLQSGIDYLRKQNDETEQTTSISVIELLDALNDGKPFEYLAGMTSRFLLHGVRIPIFKNKTSADSTIKPIYLATEQQFKIEVDEKVVPLSAIKLELPTPAEVSCIRFIDYPKDATSEPNVNGSSLTYDLTPEANYDILELHSAHYPTKGSPKLLEFYNPTPQRYTIRQQSSLESEKVLLDLPKDLCVYLQNKEKTAVLTLRSNEIRVGEALAEKEVSGYTWATKIKLKVRRVVNSTSFETLPTTYGIESLDESSKTLVNQILKGLKAKEVTLAGIDLLYLDSNSDTRKLVDGQNSTVSLLKTNLSIGNYNPPIEGNDNPLTNASLSVYQEFLQLLLEGNAVNGEGYYLYYYREGEEEMGLPDKLFTDDTTATTILLINFKSMTGDKKNREIVGKIVTDNQEASNLLRTDTELPSLDNYIIKSGDSFQSICEAISKEKEKSLDVLAEGVQNSKKLFSNKATYDQILTVDKDLKIRVTNSSSLKEIAYHLLNQPESYHNCCIIDDPQLINKQTGVINEQTGLFVESSQTLDVLQIPAGNLGFRLDHTPEGKPDSAQWMLENLYQLLSYEIPEKIDDKPNTDFVTGYDRLPIGPIEEDDDDTELVYEKVLPVYALTTAAATKSKALPEVLKDTINPYYGIGKKFKLKFRWQDIFGNRLGTDGDFLEDKDITLGYFDPIFGINQWPSVGESYTITPNPSKDNTANLNLELVFDQSKYIPTPTNPLVEALDHIKTDRATYQQIYYQVHDPKLTFTVSTSVIQTWNQNSKSFENWSQDLQDRAVFTNFVDSVYRYLVTLEYLTEFESPISGNSEDLESVAKKYGVDLGDLADINRAESGIFKGGQEEIQIPVGILVRSSDNLDDIAGKLQGDQSIKVEEIVKTYAKTSNLLASDVVIKYTDSANNPVSYTGDTFESIAIAKLAMEEDKKITLEIGRIAESIATQDGILADGILLKTVGSQQRNDRKTKIAVNSTLEEIAYHLLRQEQEDITIDEKMSAVVALNLTTPDLLKSGTTIVISTVPVINYIVKDKDTLEIIKNQLSLDEEELVEVIQDIEGLFSDNAVNSQVLIVADEAPEKITVEPNAKLSAIANNLLQQEWGSVDLEVALTRKIEALVSRDSNQFIPLQAGTVIPGLNGYEIKKDDTLSTLRSKVDLSELITAIRDVRGLFPEEYPAVSDNTHPNASLAESNVVLTGQNVLGESVSIHVVGQNNLEKIAAAVGSSLTVAEILSVNADQPDLLINDDVTLNEIAYTYETKQTASVTEETLISRIKTIIDLNKDFSLKVGTQIPKLNYLVSERETFIVRDGYTFKTIIDEVKDIKQQPDLTSGEAEAEAEALKEVAQATRNVRGLFSGSEQELSLKAGQPKIDIAIIDLTDSHRYQVKPQDSFRRIAMQRVLTDRANLPDSLEENTLVELDTLQYDVVPSQAPRSLTELTYNLNLATNRHRTVLETVQAIGNISDILTEETIEAQLSTVATNVSNINGLFGTGDIILSDVLFNYTITGGNSFDTMIAKVAESEPEHYRQILTDQTTAADIAVQNRTKLKLKVGEKLRIPDRFRFSPENLEKLQKLKDKAGTSLLKQSKSADSLADLVGETENGITPAAVAIANQSLVGLLSANHSIDIRPVLASLSNISYNGDLPINSDLEYLKEYLKTFIDAQTIQTGTDETLYTLTSRLAQAVVNFKKQIDEEASQIQQRIGAVDAIYEQLTFEGANLTSLHASLDTALTQLKATLLDNGATLKPQLQLSTVHKQHLFSVSLNFVDKLDDGPVPPSLREQFDKEGYALAPEASGQVKQQDENRWTIVDDNTQYEIRKEEDTLNVYLQELLPVQTLLQDALYARKDDASGYAYEPLDGIHRIYELSCLKTAVDLLEKRSQRPLTVAEVGTAIANIPGLVAPNQNWIVPPVMASTTLNIGIRGANNNLLYPEELLFPVNVQVKMSREADLMDPGSVPEAQSSSAYFSPKTTALTSSPDDENSDFSDRLASLDPFAKEFEAGLPDLKLAVGSGAANIDNANPQNSDTLWAVHLGDTGIRYNINETFPFFFSAAPLTNTLMSGTVQHYQYTSGSGLQRDLAGADAVRVDAVDLNGLARTYLRAIEDILKPEIAVPAVNDSSLKAEIERILKVKASLADAISKNVTHVLETDYPATNPAEYAARQELAVAALRKELLTNLADAYDIETIVQYNVDVAIADGYTWPTNLAGSEEVPRLSGQPIITGAHYTDSQKTPNATSSDEEKSALLQSLDFTLSPAKIALDAKKTNNGQSTITFFFNTQTPQRYEDIAVNLMYQVNELEYNIDSENSTSSWLNFVVPLNEPGTKTDVSDPNHIGDVQIPIPLRDYPLPPSLIAHKAVPDPDGFSGDILSAEDIRDWNYVLLYEHPDVAQDTIECRIDYSSTSPKLTIDDVPVHESEGIAVFTVSLFPPSEQVVTVDYTTKAGTAKAGEDYKTTSGKLEFKAGDTTQKISVTIFNDDIVEDNEAFTVVLSNATNAEIASTSPKLTIDDVPVHESEGIAVFTVSLFPLSEQVVTVDYTTKAGTAKAGEDYKTTSGKLEFKAGDTTQKISVTIFNDDIVEDNEAFTVVLSNATNAEIADAEGIGTIIDASIAPLLDTLVRFDHLYPTLSSKLKPLATGIINDNVYHALNAFATLADEVAKAWQRWQPVELAQASRSTIHYNIDEDLSVDEQIKTVTIAPTANLPGEDQQILKMELPGYWSKAIRQQEGGNWKIEMSRMASDQEFGISSAEPAIPDTNLNELKLPDEALKTSYKTLEFDFSKLPDTTGVETFGESALPDRKVTVIDLDVLDYQNAWGAIRLARNKNLIVGKETNPAFIFQTPEVRFQNRVTPLIINDKRWDIGALGNPRCKTLEAHVKELFKTLLPADPAEIKRPYDIRIACQYAFALALGEPGADDDLLASLPVLLTPRFTVQKTKNAPTMLGATQQLRKNIVTEIQNWYKVERPNETSGRYVFSVSLFSHADDARGADNPNLPLLIVEHLYLMLEDVTSCSKMSSFRNKLERVDG